MKFVGFTHSLVKQKNRLEGATVGAGAVVVKDVQPGMTVVGVPARELSRKSPS